MWLGACSDTPNEPRKDRFALPEQPAEVLRKPEPKVLRTTVAAPRVQPSQSEPVPVVLVWEGVANLHKGFFSEPELVAQLGRDLAGYVRPPVNVYVTFDSKRHIGRILVRLLPDTGMGLWKGADNQVDLAALSPVMQGLARYRNSVAQRFDTRVNAFHVGVESYRGSQHCRFGAAGTPPPDGTVVDPCVLLNGREHCGEAEGSLLVFPEELSEQIQRCLN